MNTARVLIIEDEPAMLRGLRDNFVRGGYRTATACDGVEGLEAALKHPPDLIVLDIMLPGANGYEICRELRSRGLAMPILMLTAKADESDVVLGLNLGADDYVTKPFRIAELLARANALLRARGWCKDEVRRFGCFELHASSRKLLREGVDVEMTPKEFALLLFFAENAGRALTRDQILDAVWGNEVFVTARSVDRCVTTLRRKIEADPAKPMFVKTVRDVGYRFEAC